MKNLDDLLNFVLENTEYNTDYKIGRQLLGYGNTAQVSGWRRRVAFPSNKDLIKMCDAAGLDLGTAVRVVEYSRENERPVKLKQAGFGNVILLSAISAGGIGGVTISNMSLLPYEAIGALSLSSFSLYIMLN